LFGTPFLVETSTEIVAKKIWHRGAEITARDIFDPAMVVEREPAAVEEIGPILRDRRDAILARIERHRPALCESFESLTVWNYQRSFDECLQVVTNALQDA
jgi:hypothetical protein